MLLEKPIFWIVTPDSASEKITAWVSKSGGEVWTHYHGSWIRFPNLTPQQAVEKVQRLMKPDVAIEVLTHTLPKFAAMIANPVNCSDAAIENCLNKSERVDFQTYRRTLLKNN